jgi:hypothetical protein
MNSHKVYKIHQSPFHAITENLLFAKKNISIQDKAHQQRHNTIISSESLDDDLDSVRKDKEQNDPNTDDTNPTDNPSNDENEESDGDANPDAPPPDDAMDSPASDSSAPPPGGGDTSGMGGMDTDDDANQQNVVGSANRRYTLFNEYNKIASILKESINSLSDIECYNTDIKDCVSQLQSATDDITYIISKFKDFSEPDLMIQFEMIKKRASIIVERLKRLKNAKHIKD